MTKEEVKQLAKSLGADLVGITSMDRFDGALIGFPMAILYLLLFV